MAARGQVANSFNVVPAVETKPPLVIFQKTKMCRFYQQGLCTRGSACMFAHDPAEIRPMPDFSRTRFCESFITKGACNDPTCTYAHNREQLRRRKPMRVEITGKSSRKNQKGSGRQVVVKEVPTACQLDIESDEAMLSPPATFSRQSTSDRNSSRGARVRERSVGSTTSDWSGFTESASSSKSPCGSTMSQRLSIGEFEVAVKNSFLHFGPLGSAENGRRCRSLPARC
mmetsp:Transcript_53132/g.124450  ORF Transcript_53132/g.124450 Transcript_53132/m.124450 type:complete len:228 (+) Transcript_53132:72-755(+)